MTIPVDIHRKEGAQGKLDRLGFDFVRQVFEMDVVFDGCDFKDVINFVSGNRFEFRRDPAGARLKPLDEYCRRQIGFGCKGFFGYPGFECENEVCPVGISPDAQVFSCGACDTAKCSGS